MRMTKGFFPYLIGACLGSGLVMASSAFAAVDVSLLAGASEFNLGHTKKIVFPTESFRTDSFKIGGESDDFAVALGAMYRFDKTNQHFRYLSVGANAYYSQTSRHGTVFEYELPNFENSTYNMQVKSARLMVDAQWDFRSLFNNKVIPFVDGGIGVANNILNFKNTPVPNFGANGGNYRLSNHSQIQFAYELGAGLKVPVNQRLSIIGRYLYANAGHAESRTYDSATGVALRQPIKVGVNSQSVLLGLNYLFG